MSATYHLFKRQGVWNYRRRVPTALIPLIGKKTVQFSLGTSDLKAAKKRRALEDLKTGALFDDAEKKLEGTTKGSKGIAVLSPEPLLTEREAVQHVQEYVRQMDARSRRQLTEDPPESGTERHEIEADVGYGLSILKNRDDPRADEWVYAAIRRILADAGRTVDEASLPHAALAELARRGLLELQQRKLARIGDDHVLAALSERDETADLCLDVDGKPEPDPELRDFELVPLKEDWGTYVAREVTPFVPDAWVDETYTDDIDKGVGRVGYEINFNRYFYRYVPPRPLEVIDRELKTLEAEIAELLREVAG